MQARDVRLLAAALLCAMSPAHAQIVTENAGAISPETPILRESVSYFAAENLREVRENNQILVSLDPTREVKLTVPVVWRDVRVGDGAGVRHEEDLFGLGDVSLRLKQSLWQRDDVLASTRWAALAEVVAPTGDSDTSTNGVDIPRRLTPGAGDWTVGAGTAFTFIRDRHRFSAEIFFRHRTPHDGGRFGDTLDVNLAYWYRIHPARFDESPAAVEVRGVIELLSTVRFEGRLGDHGAADDGLLLSVAPGVQVYPSKTVLLEGNFQVPIYQSLDDAIGDREWGATLAVKLLF